MEQSAGQRLPPPTISQQSTQPHPQPPRIPSQTVRSVLRTHVVRVMRALLPPLGIVLTMLMVFITFLIAEQLLLASIDWAARDILSRSPFVVWFLDGVRFFSFVGVAVYCIVSGNATLHTHWKMAHARTSRPAMRTHAVSQVIRWNTPRLWTHLGGAIVLSALSYTLMRAVGYVEALSFRLGVISTIFSIVVPVVTAPQPHKVSVRLGSVGGQFVVILLAVNTSIVAAGPNARTVRAHLGQTIAGLFAQPRIVVGMLVCSVGALLLYRAARLPLVPAPRGAARVYRGSLVLTENNGAAAAIAVQRRMTIYRPGRILTIQVRLLPSLLKRRCLVVSVRIKTGGASFEQTIELQPKQEFRIDLWTTVKWEV